MTRLLSLMMSTFLAFDADLTPFVPGWLLVRTERIQLCHTMRLVPNTSWGTLKATATTTNNKYSTSIIFYSSFLGVLANRADRRPPGVIMVPLGLSIPERFFLGVDGLALVVEAFLSSNCTLPSCGLADNLDKPRTIKKKSRPTCCSERARGMTTTTRIRETTKTVGKRRVKWQSAKRTITSSIRKQDTTHQDHKWDLIFTRY